MTTASHIRVRSHKAAADTLRIALNSNVVKEPGELFGVRQNPIHSVDKVKDGTDTLYVTLPKSVEWNEVLDYAKSLGLHFYDRPFHFVLRRAE
jgi:hypothetical protein